MNELEVTDKAFAIIQSGRVANIFKANKLKETQEINLDDEVIIRDVICVVSNLNRLANGGSSTLFFIRSKESHEAFLAKKSNVKTKVRYGVSSDLKRKEKEEERKRRALEQAELIKAKLAEEIAKKEARLKERQEEEMKRRIEREKILEQRAIEREEARIAREAAIKEMRAKSRINRTFSSRPRKREKNSDEWFKSALARVSSTPRYGDPTALYFKSFNFGKLDFGNTLHVCKKASMFPYYDTLKKGDVVELISDDSSATVVIKCVRLKNGVFSIALKSKDAPKMTREFEGYRLCGDKSKHKDQTPKTGPWKKPHKGLKWQDMPPNNKDDSDAKKLNFALFRRGLVRPSDFLTNEDMRNIDCVDLDSVDVESLKGVDKFIHMLKLQYRDEIIQNSNN